jgi:hypothetical protein
MLLKDKIMNFIIAHPKIAPKLAVFGIGLAITFAIGIAIGIGIETVGIFHVQSAHAACEWYNSNCGNWYDHGNWYD